jgi:hypothetical protein
LLFLAGKLEELNSKLALQLDTSPVTNRFGQISTDKPAEEGITVFLAGSSYSSRLIDNFKSATCIIWDSKGAGLRITESAVTAKADNLEEKMADLNPASIFVLVQLFDNSIYECELLNEGRVLVCYPSGGSIKLNACILFLAHMVYL